MKQSRNLAVNSGLRNPIRFQLYCGTGSLVLFTETDAPVGTTPLFVITSAQTLPFIPSMPQLHPPYITALVFARLTEGPAVRPRASELRQAFAVPRALVRVAGSLGG
ncbi:hypothetical protein SKAU_G00001340 [Synaphobranchus kaupii]|uniref:Uncharacterized protein n=1 Tax=Synaphobranchus kaupii TaxID=118154 RepID=A0A9Q1G9E5_SYNKA|nr:hypothetical protein SKAU_G00001340 [Synaphobranchus kaupii]